MDERKASPDEGARDGNGLAGAVPQWNWIHVVGLWSLWAAAALTLITGWDYLRVGIKHMD